METSRNYEEDIITCSQIAATLPEPKNEKENQFLSSLNSGRFYLGISDIDTEGEWLYTSNVAPVLWTKWGSWGKGQEPCCGRNRNCGAMINREKEKGLWGAKVCHQAHIDSLVCEMTSEYYYDFIF